MPLEAHLDLATHVVVGHITQIQETDPTSEENVHWGRATVAVKQVLKGAAAKNVTFRVMTRVRNSDAWGQAPQVHRVGDSGIWLIEDDKLSFSFGLLPEDRTEEVRCILKMLGERKWSEPVNELRAWATVVRAELHPNPVIIFAVRNDSKADIFVPPFITAIVTSQNGQVSSDGFGVGSPEKVFCTRLPAGHIAYLHPGCSFIDLAGRQKVPPGKCSVVIACKNTQEAGETNGEPGQTVRCTAWTGELKAPPVELVLPAGKKVQEDAP